MRIFFERDRFRVFRTAFALIVVFAFDFFAVVVGKFLVQIGQAAQASALLAFLFRRHSIFSTRHLDNHRTVIQAFLGRFLNLRCGETSGR